MFSDASGDGVLRKKWGQAVVSMLRDRAQSQRAGHCKECMQVIVIQPGNDFFKKIYILNFVFFRLSFAR